MVHNVKVSYKIEPWFLGLLEVIGECLECEVRVGRMSEDEALEAYKATFHAGYKNGIRISNML